MIKLFINGQEVEFPNELKPMIEGMAKMNMVKSLKENQAPKEDQVSKEYQSIKKNINPFDLLSSLTKQFTPFLEERKPVESIPKTLFDINKKIFDLEQRMTNVERILIKRQLEKEKKVIKHLVKDKPVIKPVIKPTQKKVVKKRVLPKTKVNKKK